jgi:hypothetical protein
MILLWAKPPKIFENSIKISSDSQNEYIYDEKGSVQLQFFIIFYQLSL